MDLDNPPPGSIVYDVDDNDVNLPDVDDLLTQMIALLEVASTDEMKKLKKTDENEFYSVLEEQFKPFVDRYYGIFKMVLKVKKMKELEPFILMITQIQNVKDGGACFEDAEKHVGYSLAKQYLPEHLINPDLKTTL